MDQLLQTVVAGRLRAVCDRQRDLIQDRDILNRFWSKDLSLWTVDESQRTQIRNNLAWVDLPEMLEPLLAGISALINTSLRDGLVDGVFLALDSSSLVARALLPFLVLAPPRSFSLLDSSHPSTIHRIETKLDLPHAVFVVSSKAGDRLEDHALFLHFQLLISRTNPSDVNQHFVSVTQDNSFLSGISRGYSFRASIPAPSHILPSFCSMLHFGPLLTGLSLIQPSAMLPSLCAMRQMCTIQSQLNPALQLAIYLSSVAAASCRYLILLSSPSLVPYSDCLGHLLGGSLAKDGSGLIPVSGNVSHIAEYLEQNAAFVFLMLAGESDPELMEKREAFRAASVP